MNKYFHFSKYMKKLRNNNGFNLRMMIGFYFLFSKEILNLVFWGLN